MKKTLSILEFQVFLQSVLESGNEICVQLIGDSNHYPEVTSNFSVNKGIPILSGFQFHVSKGHITLFFDQYAASKKQGVLNPPLELTFHYERDNPKGYWLYFGNIYLFFKEEGVIELLENLKEEVRKEEAKLERQRELNEEANQNLSRDVLESIDNILEY
ncbi:hypothetical protein [Fictibacillus arsenicus]|uniref:Uncharacterized protein n=1 Tax=Fictibacillus arsenicus TaxID=255247 RepID=A0A1V3GBF2_9BACL|nr:hypothetical protein [Fictibacillus arsenicus]OOE14032.1 hypothetical protein UN64_02125 [Fictibacillus arsenicus]